MENVDPLRDDLEDTIKEWEKDDPEIRSRIDVALERRVAESIAGEEQRYRCANGHLIVTKRPGLKRCTAAILAVGSPDLYFRGPDTAPRMCWAEIVQGPLVYNDDDELIDGTKT